MPNRKSLRGWCVAGRDERGPSLAGFRFILSGSAGNVRDADQMMAVGALNLPARRLLVALQMLLAVRTGEFELVHRIQGAGFVLLLRT